jgi:ribosomal protein L32
VLGFLVQRFLNRNQEFKLGEYGMAGGAVCKACGLPFSRHTFSPNLLVGKLERCPHCGKTAIARRATPDQLAEAEARLQAEEGGGMAQSDESPEERLRRQIEQSRYD